MNARTLQRRQMAALGLMVIGFSAPSPLLLTAGMVGSALSYVSLLALARSRYG